MVETSSSDRHRNFGRDSPELLDEGPTSLSSKACVTSRMVGCESMVFSPLTGMFDDEAMRVVSEDEWRLVRLIVAPRSVPILDPAVEKDLRRIESDSDLDVLKASPLKMRLSVIKRGLMGILTESLLLFCLVSL